MCEIPVTCSKIVVRREKNYLKKNQSIKLNCACKQGDRSNRKYKMFATKPHIQLEKKCKTAKEFNEKQKQKQRQQQ